MKPANLVDFEIVPAIVAQPAIEVRNLTKCFKKRVGLGLRSQSFTALDNVSFSVSKGEIYGILGTNGSGKSTLIRALSTLLIPDSGSITIFGIDALKEPYKIKCLINRVSVEAAFYRMLSPRENLIYSAGLYGISPAEAEIKSLAILKKLGLKEKAFYEPLEDMSRGMQQKVAIARALLAAPILVLLDEPTTGLDPKSRRDVQELVLGLRKTHDATVIVTTHDMAEAEALCDRIVFIKDGGFVAEGTSGELRALAGEGATLEDAFIKLTGKELEK